MKIVALYTSYTRNSFSDTALSALLDTLARRFPNAEISRFVLPELITELPTSDTLRNPDEIIDQIGDAIFASQVVVIGSPLYNFTYSTHLHVLFHKLRDRLLMIDSSGDVVGRHLNGKLFFLLMTGRSNRARWWILARHLVAGQFSFLLRFWGGSPLGYYFIGGCHPGMLEEKRGEILRAMPRLAKKLAKRIDKRKLKTVIP